MNAAEARADRAYSRRNILGGVADLWRRPVEFQTAPQEFVLLGVSSREARPMVIMPGHEVTIRDRRGSVVFAEQAPNWAISLKAYAQFITDNPRPLTRRQVAKVTRRG
jgi:hypothetical protein